MDVVGRAHDSLYEVRKQGDGKALLLPPAEHANLVNFGENLLMHEFSIQLCQRRKQGQRHGSAGVVLTKQIRVGVVHVVLKQLGFRLVVLGLMLNQNHQNLQKQPHVFHYVVQMRNYLVSALRVVRNKRVNRWSEFLLFFKHDALFDERKQNRQQKLAKNRLQLRRVFGLGFLSHLIDKTDDQVETLLFRLQISCA